MEAGRHTTSLLLTIFNNHLAQFLLCSLLRKAAQAISQYDHDGARQWYLSNAFPEAKAIPMRSYRFCSDKRHISEDMAQIDGILVQGCRCAGQFRLQESTSSPSPAPTTPASPTASVSERPQISPWEIGSATALRLAHDTAESSTRSCYHRSIYCAQRHKPLPVSTP